MPPVGTHPAGRANTARAGTGRRRRGKAEGSTPPANAPRTLLAHIRALVPTLAPSQRRVAAAVTSDPAGVAARTISQLAAQCRTSETTVIRFCRAIGLAGYPELRIALAAAAQAGAGSGREQAGSDIGPSDSLGEIITKIAYADAKAVEETAEQLDTGALTVVVELVARAPRTDIYGVGASSFVAADLQQKLHRIGRVAYAWPDPHMALTSAALLGRQDVAIGISHTGSTVDVIDSLAEARRQGAATVAVTNFPNAAISRVADHVLTTAARETTFRSGATASRIAALTVVDCLFVAVAQRSYKQTVRALERTYAAVQARRVNPPRA